MTINFTNINFFKRSIFIAIILALVFGFAYSLSQQVFRQSANDPQIQIAEDAANSLSAGEGPVFLRANTYGTVDIAKSLAPFLITFDSAGKPLASTVVLNGKTPVPPTGVFAYAKAHGENRLTWQPAAGVRIAMVLVYYSGNGGGYILSGRSLTETEKRSSSLEFLTFWAWLLTVIIVIISHALVLKIKK
jgi:hypothetical protein